MGLEKPWEKKFNSLIGTLREELPVKILGTDKKSSAEGYAYPILEGEFEGRKFSLEISEFPGIPRGPSPGEESDNVEYIRISINFPSKYKIQITHEGVMDRIEKFLHIDYEYQTGNKEFDANYFLRVTSEADKKILSNKEVQEVIPGLEPFDLLEISPSGIHWSQMITDNKQLDYDPIKSYILKLLAFANTVS